MPTQVTFRVGTKAQYDALQQKDAGCLYFLTDKNLIYRGTTLVTSRYLISSIPPASNPDNIPGVRLTDQATGAVYDLPLFSAVADLLSNNFALRYNKMLVGSQADMLGSIEAMEGVAASGIVAAGTVYRVECNDYLKLNPGQFAGQEVDELVAKNHDLIVALYDLREGKVIYPDGSYVEWKENHALFAVIPTDLVNLVAANDNLDNNRVVLGAGYQHVKSLPFAGANKVLRTNSSNNGVEWVTPETVENVVYWENIAVEEP